MPEAKPTSVILDIRPGESIQVAGLVEVRLLQKSGRVSRLRVTAPKEMQIKKQADLSGFVPSMRDLKPS